MSAVTTARIKAYLDKTYRPHIDMADWASKDPVEAGQCLLSRALCAAFLRERTGCDAVTAGSSITDGYNDNAIDAVYFDQNSDIFYILNSKWSDRGGVRFDGGDAAKLVSGARKLLNNDLSQFNDRFKAKQAEISEALLSGREVRIVLALIHMGTSKLSPYVIREIKEFIAELNDPVEIASMEEVDQSAIYDTITSSSKDPKIQLQIALSDWGQTTNPFLSYYGRVGVSQVAKWWKAHKGNLFSKNLRLYYPNSAVNDAVKASLTKSPENFWYLNNGITLIADSIVRAIAGAPMHKLGLFTCEGASIVNGAQTVGSVGEAFDIQGLGDEVEEAGFVQVRLISLENCPPEFAADVTRAANLQNAVGTREFASMDPTQHRLALDFALDGRRYVYKSGDSDPVSHSGCTIYEATQALGCRFSVKTAVDVKRNVGSIWANPKEPPYTEIFPKNISAIVLWRSVLVLRDVEVRLQEIKTSGRPKAEEYAKVRGNGGIPSAREIKRRERSSFVQGAV